MAAEAAAPLGLVLRRPDWRTALHSIVRRPLGSMAFLVVVLLIAVALFALVLAPYSLLETRPAETFAQPSAKYWLGTDDFGRDVLSRLIWGAQMSLGVSLISVLIGTTAGAALGVVSASFGGKTDLLLQRLADVLMAFPTLLFALTIVAALGSSIRNEIVAIALDFLPGAARTVRSAALTVSQLPFVEAARAVGSDTTRILCRHVVPNCLGPYIVLVSASIRIAAPIDASLSFLGPGAPPPESSWGSRLSGAGRRYVEVAPWLAVFPGIAVTLAVFAFNLVGDAVQVAWDPRLRNQ